MTKTLVATPDPEPEPSKDAVVYCEWWVPATLTNNGDGTYTITMTSTLTVILPPE